MTVVYYLVVAAGGGILVGILSVWTWSYFAWRSAHARKLAALRRADDALHRQRN